MTHVDKKDTCMARQHFCGIKFRKKNTRKTQILQKFSTLKMTQYTVLDQTIIDDVQNLTFSLLMVDLFLFYNVF